MITHHDIAKLFVAEATRLSSMAMLGKMDMDAAIMEYRLMLDTLEKQPDEVKFHFAWQVQNRTREAIAIYNRMGPNSRRAMISLLPENLTMTVLCYDTVSDILKSDTQSHVTFLCKAFNALPRIDQANPEKTFQTYCAARKHLP